MTTSKDGNSAATVTVGVFADPVAAPKRVAKQLADDLPGLLAERLDDDARTWTAEVHPESVPPSNAGSVEMMDRAEQLMQERRWDLVVCVTDQPLRDGKQPIVAEMSSQRRVVVVSLPPFGGMRLRPRVRDVVTQLIADMYSSGTPEEGTEQHRRRRLALLSNRFQRATPDIPGVDVRMLASHGGVRLLVGMVRDNRPWRLVLGLTGPLVGAFAFSAFYLFNTTIWELSNEMEPWRLLAAVLGAIAVMVTWIIFYHHLWEPIRHRSSSERNEAVLFNASTMLTLTIGVGCMYIGLYLANLLVSAIVFTPKVLGQYLPTSPGPDSYVIGALLVTAAATVAGAIGSGFESEDSIREASFSYRENERRQSLHDSQAHRTQRDGQNGSLSS